MTSFGTRDTEHQQALRAIGSMELIKGLAVFAGALWLFLDSQRDFVATATALVNVLHVAPGGRFASWLLDLVSQVTPEKVRSVALIGFAYSGLRFIEAYGLLTARIWAEWFAILSCAIFIPFEIAEILRESTVFRWGLLLLNSAILAYLVHIRYAARRRQHVRPGRQVELETLRRAS